jgi:hypothetical protein
MTRLLAPRVTEFASPRMRPVDRESTYTSVYYRQEDGAPDETAMLLRVAVDSSRQPVEILVGRHAIVELYRRNAGEDGEVCTDLREESDGGRASVIGRLRKTLLLGFWLLAAYGAWCAVGLPLAAGTAPHGIVHTDASELRSDGSSRSN